MSGEGIGIAGLACPDLNPAAVELPGSDLTIDGAVHSNCTSRLNGSSNTFTGAITYVGNITMPGSKISSIIADTVVLSGSNFSLEGLFGDAVTTTSKIVLIK